MGPKLRIILLLRIRPRVYIRGGNSTTIIVDNIYLRDTICPNALLVRSNKGLFVEFTVSRRTGV